VIGSVIESVITVSSSNVRFIQFVEGRTNPNIGSILGCEADILQLDVMGVTIELESNYRSDLNGGIGMFSSFEMEYSTLQILPEGHTNFHFIYILLYIALHINYQDSKDSRSSSEALYATLVSTL